MYRPRVDPSPTALRFPLSPRERAGILIFIPLQGERGDRKAVGEGSLSTQSTLREPCTPSFVVWPIGFPDVILVRLPRFEIAIWKHCLQLRARREATERCPSG